MDSNPGPPSLSSIIEYDNTKKQIREISNARTTCKARERELQNKNTLDFWYVYPTRLEH